MSDNDSQAIDHAMRQRDKLLARWVDFVRRNGYIQVRLADGVELAVLMQESANLAGIDMPKIFENCE